MFAVSWADWLASFAKLVLRSPAFHVSLTERNILFAGALCPNTRCGKFLKIVALGLLVGGLGVLCEDVGHELLLIEGQVALLAVGHPDLDRHKVIRVVRTLIAEARALCTVFRAGRPSDSDKRRPFPAGLRRPRAA